MFGKVSESADESNYTFIFRPQWLFRPPDWRPYVLLFGTQQGLDSFLTFITFFENDQMETNWGGTTISTRTLKRFKVIRALSQTEFVLLFLIAILFSCYFHDYTLLLSFSLTALFSHAVGWHLDYHISLFFLGAPGAISAVITAKLRSRTFEIRKGK